MFTWVRCPMPWSDPISIHSSHSLDAGWVMIRPSQGAGHCTQWPRTDTRTDIRYADCPDPINTMSASAGLLKWKWVNFINPCFAELLWGNLRKLHLLSFLNTEMVYVLEIPPDGRKGSIYPTCSKSWLPMQTISATAAIVSTWFS